MHISLAVNVMALYMQVLLQISLKGFLNIKNGLVEGFTEKYSIHDLALGANNRNMFMIE